MNPRFRLIIIALVLVASGWALWPTWKYSQVNAEREALVETAESTGTDEAWAALDQWDSTNYDDWLSYRADRIKLGLDLRGGVYFTMEVDVPALLYESADGDLIDDEFEQVIFYGEGACGYAAAAFSVAAPGARVVALRPQATLDPRVTEWDDRFTDMRRMDFTSRYGFAPDMLDAASQAYVLYDPAETLDAMHAALFTRINATKLRMPHMGAALQTDLMEMGQLAPMLEAVEEGTLDTLRFAQIFRARRHPIACRRTLAFGTVPVLAGIVGDVLMTALCARGHMPAERLGSAGFN